MTRDQIRALLAGARNIVVFGCSHESYRTSHQIAQYLQRSGYRVIPVNPYYEEILNEKTYPDIGSIPAEVEIDIVNVFRKPMFTAEVVDQIAQRMEETGQKPAIWTQVGVSSQEAQRKAAGLGLTYISNRCIMIDHSILE